MFPQNSQIDLSMLLKDIYQAQENQQQGNNMNPNGILNGGVIQQQLQQLQQQLQSSQPQQNTTAQMIQEKINLYLQQQQLQIQQQQLQLSDLAALSAQLTSGNSQFLSNALFSQPTSNKMANDNVLGFQNQNPSMLNKSNNIFSDINTISNTVTSNNSINNQNQPSFNFSSSAQNMIFQNLQNQLSQLNGKSMQDSCSDLNQNMPQNNQSPQKPNFSNISSPNNNDSLMNSPNSKMNMGSPPISPNQFSPSQKPTNFNNTTHNPNGSNSGRWTREEHLRFVKGLGLYGKNWKKVEEYVGTRSGAQIRSHAQKFFNKIQRENAKNIAKQQGGKNGNTPSNQMQEDALPSMRKRQQSTQSNYSCDFGSDDGEEDNNLQNQNQFADIIPEQSKQKDAKEWLHYYRLLQSTCQQNLESQKQNKSLSTDQIQQMEEQLKKIQIFIQVLSACDNINQPLECASPMSQGSPIPSLLPFSFENLNINSPLMQASPGGQQMNKQVHQSPIIEINTFSLDGNHEEDNKFSLGSKTPNYNTSLLDDKHPSSSPKGMNFGSIFKRLNDGTESNDQQSNTSEDSMKKSTKSENLSSRQIGGGVIHSKLNMKKQNAKSSKKNESHMNDENSSSSQHSQAKKKNQKSSYSVEVNIDEQHNQDGEDYEEVSEQPTNRPNNLSNSAISSNDQNSTLSTPENQKILNFGGKGQFGFYNTNGISQNSVLSNIQLVGDNIDIESDFSQIKNLNNNNLPQKLKKQYSQPVGQSDKIVMPIASPPLESCKKTPFFSATNTPIKLQHDPEIDTTQPSSSKSFKLEPSFFIFFMKKYGKCFTDPLTQSPKLSDLVNMNSQQFMQDCVIEEFSLDKDAKSASASTSKTNSPIMKRRQATERAQNFMDLEEDYGVIDHMPALRKKQSSFSAYSNQNKTLLSSLCSNSQQSPDSKNPSPLINKYLSNYTVTKADEEKQQKIINFRKKLKTTDYTNNNNNAFVSCLNSLTQGEQTEITATASQVK